MIAAKHRNQNRLILAVCDEEICGKFFMEGKKTLDTRGNFFSGNKVSEQELERLAGVAVMINVIGEKSVAFFRKIWHIKEENVKKVSNIPHIQIFKV